MATRRKTGAGKTVKSKANSSAKPESIFLLLGDDAYLRDQFREEIIQKFLKPEDREYGLARVDLAQEPLLQVLGRALSPGLFAARQVLVLTRVEKLREEEVKHLEAYFDSPAEQTVLIFEAARLDKRTRGAKLLLENCEVHEVDSPEDDAFVLEAVGRFAKELGVQLERNAAEDLVFAVGNNLGLLRREMEKLQVFAGDGGTIQQEDVAALVTQARNFNVFEMADFLAERRRGQALLRLRRMLAMGESPIGVVGALAYVFRQLLRARKLPRNSSSWQAAKTLRMQGARAEAMVRQAHKFSSGQLRKGLGRLLAADIALKSSAPDPVAILETLVVDLTLPADELLRSGAGR